MKFLIFLFSFFLFGAEIDEPPIGTGNIWIINKTECTDLDVLMMEAVDSCDLYKQIPIDISYRISCLKWYIGIAGPYAVPGAYQLEFRCY